MLNKKNDDIETGGKSDTLPALAALMAPRTYRYWKRTAQQLAALNRPVSFSEFSGVRNVLSAYQRPIGEPAWKRDAENAAAFQTQVVLHPQTRRRREIERRRAVLFDRITALIRECIADERRTTTGIGPTGASIQISRDLAPQVVIDLEANTLSTPDGGVIWRAITVKLTGEPRLPLRSGSGNTPFATDGVLVARVLADVESGKHKSMRAAALAILREDPHAIPGGGTINSRAKRVADKANREARRASLK